VRYALLNGHPRKQLNFVPESLHSASATLDRLRSFDAQIRLRAALPEHGGPPFQGDWGPFRPAFDSLCDDLNVPEALGHIFTVLKQPPSRYGVPEAAVVATAFRQVCTVLGYEFWKSPKAEASVPAEILALANKRWEAKRDKDFAVADAIRKELLLAGWTMLDAKEDYKLEPLKKA
jgi:cysteinyl-tRNA synthetase